MTMASHELSPEYVRKIARLARLELSDGEVARFQPQLAAVLGYVNRLSTLNLEGVEPLTNVADAVNRLDDDVPGPALPIAALLKMAPEAHERFVRIPRVLEDGGGA
ncbi:MAG: Asp-tRNA(Asn)/Glu-tRNA(Gln) amidotransferase subunit GatC [Phycisphaerales bacterium]|nr:Asp-tRNA(Asn)/Glu-tRNA(Gln) amidotransferase subunit GatC [Phycisphaerales bacterium]